MIRKYILASLMIVSCIINTHAQVPQKMNYQAVIRTSDNQLVVSRAVRMRISLMTDSMTATASYVETHQVMTNAFGVVQLQVGGGTLVTGTFAAIPWSKGKIFIKTETDPVGGTNYTLTSTTQMISVPYALYASEVPVTKSGDTITIGKSRLIIPGIKDLSSGNPASTLTTSWKKQLYNQFGGFGRAILSNNYLIISGASWPTMSSGTTDQMITKIDTSGNIVWQKLRSPGADHDSYTSVYEFKNGNILFFGTQNAQGTQYFDGFWTLFDSNGNELKYGFFPVNGSTSGSDVKRLPNGNFVFTGNHSGGSNYVVLTDSLLNQIQYKTFYVKGWNNSQLAVTVDYIFAIGSETSTTKIKIAKYDHSLNLINVYEIGNTNYSETYNYDVELFQDNLYLAGYSVKNNKKYGSLFKLNQNLDIVDSYIDTTESSYTAITTDSKSIYFAKSILNGNTALNNKIIQFIGNGKIGTEYTLNNGSPFVPFDLVCDGVNIYCVGVLGTDYWIGYPAIEKVKITN